MVILQDLRLPFISVTLGIFKSLEGYESPTSDKPNLTTYRMDEAMDWLHSTVKCVTLSHRSVRSYLFSSGLPYIEQTRRDNNSNSFPLIRL